MTILPWAYGQQQYNDDIIKLYDFQKNNMPKIYNGNFNLNAYGKNFISVEREAFEYGGIANRRSC